MKEELVVVVVGPSFRRRTLRISNSYMCRPLDRRCRRFEGSRPSVLDETRSAAAGSRDDVRPVSG